MKHENFWVVFAAASASVLVIGGAATAALAQPPQATTTIIAQEMALTGTSSVRWSRLRSSPADRARTAA